MSVTTWYINGVKYTGRVVTVGPSGCDYTSLVTAISSATQDTLFLIYPGSYGPYGHIYFDKNIKYYIKRVGGTQPSDVLVTLTDYFQQTNGNVIIEGCKFYRNGYEIYHAASGTYHINKCVLDSRFCFGHGSATWNTLTAVGTVSYTDMYSRYGAWFAHVAYVYYPTTSLIKVAHGGDYNYWRTYNKYARSHFAVEDYAPIGTSGYGSEYGNDLITKTVLESILINSSKTTFNIGYVEQLTAVGVYSDGRTEDYTSLVTWSSSNPSVLGVSNSGLIVAYSNGNASITITYDELTFTTNFCIESSVPPLKIAENSSAVLSEFGSSDVIDINNISTCVNLWSSPSSVSIPTTKSIVNYASSIKYPQWRIDADEKVVVNSHRSYNINSGMLFNSGEFSLADNSVLFVGTGIN